MIKDASLRKTRIAMNVSGIAFLVLILALMCIPRLDGPHHRQHANEAATVGTLRSLATLEQTYLIRRAGQGYACEFSQLKEVASTDEHNQGLVDQLATDGSRAGYRIAFSNCRAEAAGIVHYQITAVPKEPGESGFRAFCMDESNVIWYDKSGSATDCFAKKNAI